MSKVEIQNEAIKYISYKASMESVVGSLDTLRNKVNDNFHGRTQDEMIESINILRNMSNDLRQELNQMQTSLNYLHDNVVQEEKRRERIRKEKEEEAKRRAEEEKNNK